MSKEIFMIESLTRDVISMIMADSGLSLREAMDAFYSSRTFISLSDTETGLYFQSPIYIYDEYKKEINVIENGICN